MTDTIDGREERFRSLFTETTRPLLTYVLRRVDEPADAADVVADVYVVAWRRIADIPEGPAARLWLYGVARRVLANQRRSDVRRARLAERLAAVVSLRPTQPDDFDGDHDGLRAALRGLRDDDRELLRLNAWEGLSPNEIVAVLGVTATTVRTRLHRARKRLRTAMERAARTGRAASAATPQLIEERF